MTDPHARIAQLEAALIAISDPNKLPSYGDPSVLREYAISALTSAPAPDTTAGAVREAASNFDRADWYWRVMDPDDCGDSPEEAVSRAMLGNFCVCEIASSFTGPIRYGFTAPVLDADSDDEEFLHFATQQEAIDAAKERQAALRAIAGDRT